MGLKPGEGTRNLQEITELEWIRTKIIQNPVKHVKHTVINWLVVWNMFFLHILGIS